MIITCITGICADLYHQLVFMMKTDKFHYGASTNIKSVFLGTTENIDPLLNLKKSLPCALKQYKKPINDIW